MKAFFSEIEVEHQQVLVGVVYRPPNQSTDEYLKSLNELLQTVQNEKKVFYLMGDFNINLLNVDKDQYVNEFLDTLLTFNMFPLIKYPTRVTQHSASLIDNIFTNDDNVHILSSGLFLSDISDHFPIYCICDKNIDDLKDKNIFSNEKLVRRISLDSLST